MRDFAGLWAVNWDFPDASGSAGIHGLHWYPGTFIPQLPAYLLRAFTDEGQLVLDPFCGCGTAIVESASTGRLGVGLDSNPLACLISNAKLDLMRIENIQKLLVEFVDQIAAVGGAGHLPFNAVADLPDERLEAWYHEETLLELRAIWGAVLECDDRISCILKVVFSSILKKCCSQGNHWGYVADNMLPKLHVYQPAQEHFVSALRSVIGYSHTLSLGRSLEQYAIALRGSRVLNEDIRYSSVCAKIDCVVTSPPYPNVIDYTHAHRLSFYWLGIDLGPSRESEIGARWKRFRRSAWSSYESDMTLAFKNILSSLASSGAVCIVLGSKQENEKYDLVKFYEGLLRSFGLTRLCDPIVRRPSRQRLRDRSLTERTETILIFG